MIQIVIVSSLTGLVCFMLFGFYNVYRTYLFALLLLFYCEFTYFCRL